MSLKWRILLGLILAAGLAYFMRDVIYHTVIEPLLFLWWMLGIYYHMLPQVVLWILMVILVVMMAWTSLATDRPVLRSPLDLHRSHHGPVESLAGQLFRSSKGLYFKWLLAQRLGKLARDLIAFNSRQSPRFGHEALTGPGWDPPREVAAYLDAGLNGSFADYPRPRWSFQPSRPTPLDLDPEITLDYLESQMEKS